MRRRAHGADTCREDVRAGLVALQVRAQAAHVVSAWPDATDWILTVAREGAPAGQPQPVGRMLVAESAPEWYVVDVRVRASWRGRGIGSTAMPDLLGRADRAGVPVHLRVDQTNPARALYERLGFRLVPDDGSGADLVMVRPTA